MQLDIINLYLLIATIGIPWLLLIMWLFGRDKKEKQLTELRQFIFQQEQKQLLAKQDYEEQIRQLKAEHERMKHELSVAHKAQEADKLYMASNGKYLTTKPNNIVID